MIIGVCLSQFWFIIIFPIKIAIWVYAPFWSVIYFRNYFLVRFSFILDSCFLLFLLLCFSASPLFDFPASSAFLASAFSASLFFRVLLFLLLCFSAFLLLRLSTSTFSFSAVVRFCCSPSCCSSEDSASLLPFFTVFLLFFFFCFILLCKMEG